MTTETQTTTLVKIAPSSDLKVMAFYNQALELQKYAEARVITAVEDLNLAANDLIIIRKVKKGIESSRKDYLQPFQEHIKEINDTFKTLMEPIEIADTITGSKMLAFTLKQKLIREEQEKINALRMEAARKEMELKGELSESVGLVEVILPTPTTIRTDMGSVGQRDHWTFEVIDFALLPDEYKMPDATKIGKVVRAGLHTIPGVRIWNEPILAGNVR